MSKNYQQYHNYSQAKQVNNNVQPTVEPEVTAPVETPVEPVAQPTMEPEVKEDPVEVIGVVIDCERLNVRRQPKQVTGNVACTIKEGAAVMIDEANSTDEFYKVCTESGVEGYCMRDYIEVK